VISNGLWRREFGADPAHYRPKLCSWTTTFTTSWGYADGFRDLGSTNEERNTEFGWRWHGGLPFPPVRFTSAKCVVRA